MGNWCSSGRSGSYAGPSKFPPGRGNVSEVSVSSEDIEYDPIKLVDQMKRYHRERLEHELENDLQTFIMDNLLMCIQFYNGNFSKVVDDANEYRRNADKEMTDLLAKDPLEGMILGDRRLKLLSGMPFILAQNYIYRGKNHSDDDEIDDLYGGVDLKNTFMTEGILPLEFQTHWDNFELYEKKDIEDVYHYSDAKGASPVSRFCIEQPDASKEHLKGYVRLRCFDEPISERKALNTPRPSDSDLGYSVEPVYSIPEAHSESEEGLPSSGTTSEEDDDMLKLKERLKNMPSHSRKAASSTDLHASPKPELTKRNLAKLQLASSMMDSKLENPNVVVHVSTPPVIQDDMFNTQPIQHGFLFPANTRRLVNHQQSMSTPNLSSVHGKETPSSGYETISSISVASSFLSEYQRDKWQKQNLKRLQDFGRRSRKDEIPPDGKYDPVPADCYFKVKYEPPLDAPLEEDDEQLIKNDNENNDGDESSEDEVLEDGTLAKKQRKNEDDYIEIRYYLHSNQFSTNACAEFQSLAPYLEIPDDSLEKGVVLGTSIRCQIPYKYPKDSPDEDDAQVGSYYMTYSFTPSLHSKSWPNNLFNTFSFHTHWDRGNKNSVKRWPTEEQLEKLEHLGCNFIPLGYRPPEFFNTEQILEWEMNFHECEINLLDSLNSAHWRTYIFTSILFRAFIAPLGPLGIGHEHIRNVLYFMCHDDFYGWNDEQPGLHLITLLGHLLNSLSRCQMPSFFVRQRNLWRSLPQQNLRLVQGHLNEVKDNLIVYCIYAFRNLISVKKPDSSYPLPDFKDFYDILTEDDGDLILRANPILQRHKEAEEKRKRNQERENARSKGKKKQPVNLIDRQDEIDKRFFGPEKEQQQQDPIQKRLEEGYDRHKRRLEERKKKTRQEKLKENPEMNIPSSEKRQSVDLRKPPVINHNGQSLRILFLIKFFIEHFLKMADKAINFNNYSLATMYVLQVENLSEIVQSDRYRDRSNPFSEEEFEKYRGETLRLRGNIGEDIGQYILSRVSSSSSLPQTRLPNEPTSPQSGYTFKNNWDLRKLPTPPPSKKPIIVPTKKLEKPNMLSSLQSFDNFPQSNSNGLTRDSQRRNIVRRQESFKFIENQSTPPATPPPRPKITSKISMSFEVDDEVESTDL